MRGKRKTVIIGEPVVTSDGITPIQYFVKAANTHGVLADKIDADAEAAARKRADRQAERLHRRALAAAERLERRHLKALGLA